MLQIKKKKSRLKRRKQNNLPSANARYRKASEPTLPDTEQTLVRSTVLKVVLFQLIDQLTYLEKKLLMRRNLRNERCTMSDVLTNVSWR